MVIIALIFASALASLIPALVVKVSMWVLFSRTVSYLMILTVMVATYILGGISLVIIGYDVETWETIPDSLAIGVSVGTFIMQAIILSLTISDEHAQSIEFWRWVIILLFQYVVYLLIGLLMIFI